MRNAQLFWEDSRFDNSLLYRLARHNLTIVGITEGELSISRLVGGVRNLPEKLTGSPVVTNVVGDISFPGGNAYFVARGASGIDMHAYQRLSFFRGYDGPKHLGDCGRARLELGDEVLFDIPSDQGIYRLGLKIIK